MKPSIATLLRRMCCIIAMAVFLLIGSGFSAAAANATSTTPNTVTVMARDDPKKTTAEDSGYNFRVIIMGLSALALIVLISVVGHCLFGNGETPPEIQSDQSTLPPQTNNENDNPYEYPPS